jgi:acyl carrier protein
MTKLNRIISDALQISEDQITPEMAIHDMPTWNSLSHIELIVSIESAFEIELSADDIVAMTSVEHIQRVLRERGAALE